MHIKLLAMENNIHLRYLVASEKDRLWGLTVNTVGYQSIRPHEPYPPQDHPQRYLFFKEKGRVLSEYQLLYIVRGKGQFSSEHCPKSTLVQGAMFLLFPGEWHTYSPDYNEGWEEYWIGFKGLNFDQRVETKFFQRENPIFQIGQNDEIVALYTKAIAVASEQKHGFQMLLAGIVNLLIGYVYALGESPANNDSKLDDTMSMVRTYIQEHLHESIYPEDLAAHFNFSYTTFRRLFKNYTGFTPAAYILEQKINKCREMLTNSRDSCQSIGFRMGFESPDYFCTVFKRKTGMTPIAYRNMTQGQER